MEGGGAEMAHEKWGRCEKGMASFLISVHSSFKSDLL